MLRKTHRNGYIFDKFSELNSQRNETIVWSSSDSSDIENQSSYNPNQSFNRTYLYHATKSRKRKRKEKPLKNSSKLEVSVVDDVTKSPTPERSQRVKFPKTIRLKVKNGETKNSGLKSPILSSPRVKFTNNLPTQDAVCSEKSYTSSKSNHRCKSPILQVNRKKYNFDHMIENGSKSPILCVNKQKVSFNRKSNENVEPSNFRNILAEILKVGAGKHDKIEKGKNVSVVNDEFYSQKSHYSITESQSGESINKLSVEIDSSSSSQRSQNYPKINRDANVTFAIKDLHNVKSRNKYPKNGLAYRLQNLLKTTNSNVLLWRNELYLSKCSNFVKPREEFSAFRVQEIYSKYGVYLLKTVNLDCDDSCWIVFNISNVSDDFKKDTILKLYKPFYVLEWQLDGMQVILNAIKYECVTTDILNW